MTLDLNISASQAPKAQGTPYVRISDEQTEMAGLSPTEKETFNLAREAEKGDSAWDKAILNLVHPPALSLYALLDSGRTVMPPPLPKVQEAYSDVEKSTYLIDAANGLDASNGTVSAKTSINGAKAVSTPAAQTGVQTQAAQAPTASATTTISFSSQTIIA